MNKQTAPMSEIMPLVRELPADTETPISVYLKLRGLGPSFLLESVEGGEHLARYSMIGTQPRALVRSFGQRVVVEQEGAWRETQLKQGDVLDVLRDLMPRYPADLDADLPRFSGGAVGYLGYDMVRAFEDLRSACPPKGNLPDAAFMLCDRLVIVDHVKHRLLLIAHAAVGDRQAAREAEAALDEMVARLRRPLPEPTSPSPTAAPSETAFASAFPRVDYEAGVRRIKEHIVAGDIFQCVLSRRMGRRTHAAPFDIYRALRRVNPSPYMFYLELPDGLRLVGSSPEVLVRLEGGVAETRPLAGTRRRGASPAQDAALETELLADPKERAEHVMLVDLARNDLGRVCQYGTVRTPILMEVERYSHVMHIVSQVDGQLDPRRDAYDLLRACFPAGTVSGAPKVRAMEIIDSIEPESRGPYAGAVGYFGFSGNMDTCITIRTMVIQGDQVFLQAGAGIVADSDPATEYEETVNKLGALSQALLLAEGAAHTQPAPDAHDQAQEVPHASGHR
jgi:anthranilate synthase component 1